jgi:predicted dehydrogenase
MAASSLRVGVVGAGGRGGSFRNALHSLGATVAAVCDLDPDAAKTAQELLQAERAFTDYAAMLAESDVHAVVIGTPMHLHVEQCIEALQKGVHVLCEVTAGVTVEECKRLVLAAAESSAIYMLAENLNYDRSCVAVSGLVDSGQLGDVYYAEGEYLHDVKSLADRTPWRRHWQLGISGLTYCTHALGPIMRWFQGDRVVRVSCVDAGSHYNDTQGKAMAGSSATMLAKTEQGRLIKIRVDLTSNRPYGEEQPPSSFCSGVDGQCRS